MERTTADPSKRLLLELLPDQGQWTEEEYLWLTDHAKRRAEFVDGHIEVLPMPTDRHQAILGFLYLAFHAAVSVLGGKVHFSGLRLQLRSGNFREPDLLLLLNARDPRRQDRFWTGADLVLEVVSKDNPERDLIRKRQDYSAARIPEYWIINPLTETITVYCLRGKSYREHGVYCRGETASSRLIAGLVLDVDAVFNAD